MKQLFSIWMAGLLGAVVTGLPACRERITDPETVSILPPVSPDYAGVTVPAEIAPLCFTVDGSFEKIRAVLEDGKGGRVTAGGKKFVRIPRKEWQALLSENKGDSIRITVAVKQQGRWKQYRPFPVYVSSYPIDYGLVYRLIAPGYEVYSKMGIYERALGDYTQRALLENTLVPYGCVNCHSFRQTIPGDMCLHVRGDHGGTLLLRGDRMEMLNLKTPHTLSAGVYPYWHPGGRYIAYSVNRTQQGFHAVRDERIEVVDLASDLIVYDVQENRVLTSPLLQTDDFETFPSFSPDGRWLYFCSAAKRNLPGEYKDIHYNLCRIAFDAATGAFGERADTLIDASARGKSISFPRPSYDGKYLMYTLSDYGNFSIWHKEADLWLLDLTTMAERPLEEVNSPDVESYHSWSSNSRWFVFSSRRGDGLYTRLYLASMDENGRATKPFLLPQDTPEKEEASFFSYNVPEFVSAPVRLNVREAEEKINAKERKQAR